MEKYILPRWIIIILGLMLIILLGLLIINQTIYINHSFPAMHISAEGKVTAIPDLATIAVGVSSSGPNVIDVKNQNNQKINQIINFIKQEKIDPSDIKTTEFSVYPKYNYANGENSIIGYQADQMITLKINNVDKSKVQLERIIDGVVNNGVNKIQGINFSFSDPEKLRQLARKKAIQNAKIKAHELAKEANLKLGKIVNLLETADLVNPSVNSMVNFSAQAKSVSPSIEIGNQEITENITVVFYVY